jgi:hypothetical protein
MAGFSPEQRSVLEASLARSPGSPVWRTCAFGDADAWFVNGRNVRVMPDGNLKVAAGLPTERALNLNLGEVDRPLAFALPLASTDFEPRCTFNPASPPSIQAVLLQFEVWLRPLRSRFILGAQIVDLPPGQRKGVYHVSHGGRLLAVLDLDGGRCAVSSAATPAELLEASWSKRPGAAAGLPVGFLVTTPAQLAWTYVHRTDRDLLPPRYTTDPIYYRRVPRVPVRWLHDSQLMLLRDLSVEPGSLNELRQRTGLPLKHLKQDLTCLYYAGAITTTRAKATRLPTAEAEQQQPMSGPSLDSMLNSTHPGDHRDDLTAPALLEPRSAQSRTDPP